MMDKKLLISAIAGSIAYFLLGWIVFGMLLNDYYDSNSKVYEGLKYAEPNLMYIYLGGLSWALMFAYIFTKVTLVNNFSRAFIISMIIGGLATLSFDFFMVATMDLYSVTMIPVDTVVNALFSGIVGGAMGWVIGLMDKTATSTA